MRYEEEQYPPTHQRRRRIGPFAIFGRGRMLSFVVMGVVSIFSFLSNNTGWMRSQPSSPGQQSVSLQQTHQQLAASRNQVEQRNQVMSSNPIELHGGVVEDMRAVQVRKVGARLAQCIPNLPPRTVKFFVLRDTTQAGSYALADGSILVTAGLLSQLTNESQLAEVLSRRMTEVLYHDVDRIKNPQIDQYPAQLVSSAGYGPQNVAPIGTTSYGNTRTAASASTGWNR